MAKDPLHIAVVRFSSIGDIVITTPVIRALRKRFPQSNIYFVTKKKFASLLQGNPHLSEVICLEDSFQELVQTLKNKQIDLIVDLHKNLRTKMLKLSLRVPRISFDKLNWEKWLMVTFKWNLLPYKHLIDRYFEALEPLKVLNDHQGMEFFISEEDKKIPPIDAFNKDLPYIVYAIGGTYATKRAPLHIIKQIIQAQPYKVVLIGDKNDQKVANELNDGSLHMANACGILTIRQSAALIEGAKGVIAHDTGMMHIAAALKKPLVSIWGNTIPEFGMFPYFPAEWPEKYSTILEVEDLSCRPCSKLGHDFCPKGHFKCMNLIQWPSDFKPFEG